MNTTAQRLPVALFLLRISVFLVMLMWTVDKFVRPEHAIKVYEKFYLLDGVSTQIMLALAIAEVMLLTLFVAGLAKRWTYGTVLLLHAISTLSSWEIYLTPYADGPNLLFFTAWPMLAACITLYMLRDGDTLLSVGGGRPSAPPAP